MDPQKLITLLAFSPSLILLFFLILAQRANGRLRRKLEHYRDQARVDSVTGLVNRRRFDELLPLLIERANRGRPQHIGIVRVDINHFKGVNDRYGHEVGDMVLEATSRCLERCVRPTDIVSRWGGDEFAVICLGVESERLEQIGYEMDTAVRRLQIELEDGRVVRWSASFGVISRSGPGLVADILMRWADRRLYRAKELRGSGRHTVVVSERRQAPVLPPGTPPDPAA